MKFICFILIVLTADSLFGSTPPTELYPIVVNKKIGFIDSTGKIIVEPMYHAAGKCAEGLIPVRKGGYYGYINTLGEVVIPFKYDYATEFSEGYGIVFVEGKPQYVDKSGENPFEVDFKELTNFYHGTAIVLGYNGKVGVISKIGKLIADTVNTTAVQIENGIYRIVMSFDKDWNPIERYVDCKGNKISDANLISKYDRRSKAASRDSRDIETLVYLRNGRYLKTIRDHYSQLIDEEGKVLRDTIFGDIKPFSNGVAIVSTTSGEGLIDTNGTLLIPAVYSRLYYSGNKDYLIYSPNDRERSIFERDRWGLISTTGKVITPPSYHWNDYPREITCSPVLIQLSRGDTSFYMTYDGNIVWTHYSSPNKEYLDTLNIDYIQYTRYSAITVRKQYIPEKPVNGVSELVLLTPGVGNFDSRPKEEDLTPTMKDKLLGGLNIIADIEDTTIYSESRMGFTLRIVNNSNQTLYLDSYNTSILPIMQALTPNGEWKDIEYFSSGWCGTGRESEAILPHKYYELEAPLFGGGVKTRLRVKMVYFMAPSTILSSESKPLIVYSNEFIGYINPGQLWRDEYLTPDKLSIFRR